MNKFQALLLHEFQFPFVDYLLVQVEVIVFKSSLVPARRELSIRSDVSHLNVNKKNINFLNEIYIPRSAPDNSEIIK